MNTSLTTQPLNHPHYVLHVIHREDDNSYIGKIVLSQEGINMRKDDIESPLGVNQGAASDEPLFVSFPQATAEEAEKAAHEYYIQLNKPKV